MGKSDGGVGKDVGDGNRSVGNVGDGDGVLGKYNWSFGKSNRSVGKNVGDSDGILRKRNRRLPAQQIRHKRHNHQRRARIRLRDATKQLDGRREQIPPQRNQLPCINPVRHKTGKWFQRGVGEYIGRHLREGPAGLEELGCLGHDVDYGRLQGCELVGRHCFLEEVCDGGEAGEGGEVGCYWGGWGVEEGVEGVVEDAGVDEACGVEEGFDGGERGRDGGELRAYQAREPG